MNGNRIKEVKARQVLNSKGRPVVETEMYTENGKMGRAGASTGTSIGKNESCVLGDDDKELFGGLSVFEAVKNIEKITDPTLVSVDMTGQQAVGHGMIELGGTRYKMNLGGNAVYSVSCAVARATAANVRKPLWRYLAEGKPERVFASAYDMVSGGAYGDYTLAFQEFIVIPKNISTFYEGSRVGVGIFQKVGGIIKKYNNGKPPIMGNYSGYDAPSDNPSVLFNVPMEVVSSLGYEDKIIFSMDCATSKIYDKTRSAYLYEGTYIDRGEMISLLSGITHKYPIGFIEDALQEEDSEGFRKARKEIQAVLIGDGFIYSSIDRAKKAIDMGAIQGMILKPNQIGTLTEAIETVRFTKRHDLLVMVSGRAEGAIDDPNTELAITLSLPITKTGAPRNEERAIFTNTGLKVEEQLKPGKAMTDVLKVPRFEWLG